MHLDMNTYIMHKLYVNNINNFFEAQSEYMHVASRLLMCIPRRFLNEMIYQFFIKFGEHIHIQIYALV